jgi:hypothetical protein
MAATVSPPVRYRLCGPLVPEEARSVCFVCQMVTSVYSLQDIPEMGRAKITPTHLVESSQRADFSTRFFLCMAKN